MVARCSAPPGLQSGANALRLPLDSFRPTFIGAEGDTPNKIWAAALQAIPPIGTPLAYFGHQGLPVPMLSRTGGGGGHIPHPPPPPYQLRYPPLSLPPLPPCKASLQGVGPTGGRVTSGGSAPVHGPRGLRYFGFRSPRLRIGPASRGSSQGRRGSALPLPV